MQLDSNSTPNRRCCDTHHGESYHAARSIYVMIFFVGRRTVRFGRRANGQIPPLSGRFADEQFIEFNVARAEETGALWRKSKAMQMLTRA